MWGVRRSGASRLCDTGVATVLRHGDMQSKCFEPATVSAAISGLVDESMGTEFRFPRAHCRRRPTAFRVTRVCAGAFTGSSTIPIGARGGAMTIGPHRPQLQLSWFPQNRFCYIARQKRSYLARRYRRGAGTEPVAFTSRSGAGRLISVCGIRYTRL